MLEELFFRVAFSILWLIVLVGVTIVNFSAKGSAAKQTPPPTKEGCVSLL